MKKITLSIVALCAVMLLSGPLSAKKAIKDPYQADIDKLSAKDNNFRSVLYTGTNMQLALVEIPKGGETGVKQFAKIEVIVFVEKGTGKIIMNGKESKLVKGQVLVIPPGNSNNIINTGMTSLELYAIVSPPMHKEGAVFKTKEEADKSDETFGIRNK